MNNNIRLQWFKNLHQSQESKSFSEIIDLIKSEEFQKPIQKLRLTLETSNEQYQLRKKQLPSFTPAGTFSDSRSLEKHDKYSQILHLDLDHLDNLEITDKLKESEYVLGYFISPSGKGLKVFYKTNSKAEFHTKNALKLIEWFQREYDIVCDRACKDISRLCFISYDPSAYYNPKAKEIDSKIATDYSHDFEKAEKKAIEQGYSFKTGDRNNFVFTFCCFCRLNGIPKDITLNYCLDKYKDQDFDAQEIHKCINSAYSGKDYYKSSIEQRYSTGKLQSIRNILSNEPLDFRKNLVTNCFEIKKDGIWVTIDETLEKE